MPIKKKIMVVDDDRDTRNLLNIFLRESGYDVLTAENGIKLVSAIQADKPDLVILDIMLQWISGYDLCRSIRNNPELSGVKIFFLSGKTEVNDIRLGYDVGCDEYMTKPCDLKTLKDKIERHIGGAE